LRKNNTSNGLNKNSHINQAFGMKNLEEVTSLQQPYQSFVERPRS
jgi:hypothetical protein